MRFPQGNGRTRIVVDHRDRRTLVDRLRQVAAECGSRLLARSLLDTHLHLAVETPQPNLGMGMRRLLGGHSWFFHLRHGGEGALFVPRFWSARVVSDEQLLRTALYVDLNPVAAGLATHPERYRWCSFGAAERPWLVGPLGETIEAAQAAYAAVVDEACVRLRARQAPLPQVVRAAVVLAREPSD